MKDATGEELIATAGAVSFSLARALDNEEITSLCELMGLVKHNLEIIKFRRFLQEKAKHK